MAKLEDLREWLLDRIDGGEEMRGEDSLISHFINQIDALPSEMGTIPSDPAATPVTDAVVKMMEAGWLSLGSSAPGAVKPLIETMEQMERELNDLKQRILPQYLGRAERAENAKRMAEHERDEMLEKLRAATSMPCAPSATAVDHGYDRTASINVKRYVCTCEACMSAAIREGGAPIAKESA